MTQQLKRFDWIAAGQSNGPDALCDVPVYANSEIVVLPTLGAIVPSWVLVVPRQCSVSLSVLSKSSRASILEVGMDAATVMENDGSAILFEHGPSNSESVVGCGVDQAHLHVVASKLDFVSSALSAPGVDWSSADRDDPWEGIDGREYYLIKTPSAAFIGYPRTPVSQFFRRHIALTAGVPECWDYKKWPNYENIRRTYEQFKGRVGAGAA